MNKRPKLEGLRRRRVHDLRQYCRHRYGAVLPDDDAGRHDLLELLRPVSLGSAPARVMANTIQIWAPWMNKAEAADLITQIQAMPPHERRPTPKTLGKQLNVTNEERNRLELWSIHPVDMTDRQMAEQRRAKRRLRDQRRRQRAGRKPRAIYLAASLTRQKPWKAEGISRRTWYRRQALPDVRQPRLRPNGTGVRTDNS